MLVTHAKGLLRLWINDAVKWPQYLRDYTQFAEETRKVWLAIMGIPGVS